MAVHEENERAAMEGELELLEMAWQDAEEIAGIADNLLVPAEVEEHLKRLREWNGPLGCRHLPVEDIFLPRLVPGGRLAPRLKELYEPSGHLQVRPGSGTVNGYNFTDGVRKVLQMAREEAARLRREYVGTEHILLGLIREGEGVAAAVLTNLNVDLEEIQQKIEETVKKGKAAARAGHDLPYTSAAKQVLELAMREARELNYSYVGTEHLLFGVLCEKMGIAAQVLTNAGVSLQQARVETLRLMRDSQWADSESNREPTD
jgi:hypothetical protein